MPTLHYSIPAEESHHAYFRRRRLALQNRASRNDQAWEQDVYRIQLAQACAKKERNCIKNNIKEKARIVQNYRDNNDSRIHKMLLAKKVIDDLDMDYRFAAAANLERKDRMVHHKSAGQGVCKKFERVPKNRWPAVANSDTTKKPKYRSVMCLAACQTKWPSVLMEQEKTKCQPPTPGKQYDVWLTM